MGNSGAPTTPRIPPGEAQAFVDFVLRHTWPERAKAHGFETLHSIIKHHPFAQEHRSKHDPSDGVK